MPLSVRISESTENAIIRESKASGKSKSAIVIEAIDRSLGLGSQRSGKVRKLSGWMSHDEAVQFRESLKVFDEVDSDD